MYNQTIIENSLIANIRLSDGAYRLYILLQYIKKLKKNNLIIKRRKGSISNI